MKTVFILTVKIYYDKLIIPTKIIAVFKNLEIAYENKELVRNYLRETVDGYVYQNLKDHIDQFVEEWEGTYHLIDEMYTVEIELLEKPFFT